MEELAANIRTSYHVECEFCASGSILDIDHAVATHLYRIAQEAAINAAKHAWPKRIEIRLEPFQSKVRISICDDGCGISSRAVRAGGMGIHIMNYRAGMIGATIDIVPRAGGGTIVTCIFEPKNGIEPAVHLQANGHSN